MIEDDGNVDQGEFHAVFIPTWCLDASDNDFLCGEDILVHPSMIIQGDESIDNINTSNVMAQSETTTIDRDKSTNEPLQISTFPRKWIPLHLMRLMNL